MNVAGQVYDKEASEALREEIIAFRNAALDQADMEWAVKLSHVVAWMAVAMEKIYET